MLVPPVFGMWTKMYRWSCEITVGAPASAEELDTELDEPEDEVQGSRGDEEQETPWPARIDLVVAQRERCRIMPQPANPPVDGISIMTSYTG